MKKSILLVILTWVMVGYPVWAQEHDNLKLSGFAFWVQEFPRVGSDNFKLKHVWLIGDKNINSNLQVKAFFALQGPPKVVHTLSLKWKNPIAGISYVRVGRFEPPFGHGTTYYRLDRNPTVLYSAIDSPIAARSNGLEIAGLWGNLEWKLGAFSGDRFLGNISASDDSRWDIYPCLRYSFGEFLSCGLSQRFGPVGARSINLVSRLDSLQMEAEAITSKDSTNYSVLGIHKTLPWLTTVLRYENVKSEDRITPGFIIHLPHDCDIKVNAVITKTGLEIVLMQFVLRW